MSKSNSQYISEYEKDKVVTDNSLQKTKTFAQQKGNYQIEL